MQMHGFCFVACFSAVVSSYCSVLPKTFKTTVFAPVVFFSRLY